MPEGIEKSRGPGGTVCSSAPGVDGLGIVGLGPVVSLGGVEMRESKRASFAGVMEAGAAGVKDFSG